MWITAGSPVRITDALCTSLTSTCDKRLATAGFTFNAPMTRAARSARDSSVIVSDAESAFPFAPRPQACPRPVSHRLGPRIGLPLRPQAVDDRQVEIGVLRAVFIDDDAARVDEIHLAVDPAAADRVGRGRCPL